LLVDVNDALSILHETTVKHGHLALSTRKLWFKKVAQKLKYCIEEIYKVEVKSSASASDENSKDLCFVLCHVGRTARNIQKIHFLYRSCSNFYPIPLHHHRKNNERVWCLKRCEQEPSIEERKG